MKNKYEYPFRTLFCFVGFVIYCLVLPVSNLQAQVTNRNKNKFQTGDSINSTAIGNLVYKLINPATSFSGKKQLPDISSLPLNKKNNKPLNSYYTRKSANYICQDTSSRYLITTDSTIIYSTYIAKTQDGDFLIPGQYDFGYNPFSAEGSLIKCSENGDVRWAVGIKGGFYNYFYYQCKELKDKSIMLAGSSSVPMQVNGTDELVLTKLDANGGLLWNKTFKSPLWRDTTSGQFEIFKIDDDVRGNIYISGSVREGFPSYAFVLKFSSEGTLLWSTACSGPGPTYGYGTVQNKDELIFFGKYTEDYAFNVNFALRLNAATGDTIASKIWYPDAALTPYINTWANDVEITELDNGHIALCGRLFNDGSYPDNGIYHHAGVAEFDRDINFIKGYQLTSDLQSNGYNTRISVKPDGSADFSMLQFFGGYSGNVFFTNIKNNQIIKERYINYTHQGIGFISNFLPLRDGGSLLVQSIGDSLTEKSATEIVKLHNSDTSSSCVGRDTNFIKISPINYKPFFYDLKDVTKNVVTETIQPFLGVYQNIRLSKESNCDKISYCDSLRLMVRDTTICISTNLVINAHKNKACGTIVQWTFDTSVVYAYQILNDTSVSILFKKPWQGYVHAIIDGCTLLTDSIKVSVFDSRTSLNIGKDTFICNGNTFLLNAGSGFSFYQWQDNSSDSFFTAVRPGTYFVNTLDGCFNHFSDTIIISPAPKIDFNVGPDLSKCNQDTLKISAPSGFINYKWLPAYNIDSTENKTVSVYPSIDTAYTIIAEKWKGCFVNDTIRITVLTSPPIHLGEDTSFCYGSSANLNAGDYFSSYQWSNGSTSQKINISTAGLYSVNALAVNGCTSSDTFQVIKIFALPLINLGNDEAICRGASIRISLSNYNTYLWQNGAVGQQYNITEPGTYWVQATDSNNCISSDTIIISAYKELPVNFLTDSLFICNGEKVDIIPLNNFAEYLWNNGSTTKAITINNEGNYWLQVTDFQGCTNKDTTFVSFKECYNALYFPTAFTPNKDGKNDWFRPTVYGIVQNFYLVIYNRFGQKIFETFDIKKGWDGTVNGMPQDQGTFVWLSTFRFTGNGEFTQNKKGTIVLIK